MSAYCYINLYKNLNLHFKQLELIAKIKAHLFNVECAKQHLYLRVPIDADSMGFVFKRPIAFQFSYQNAFIFFSLTTWTFSIQTLINSVCYYAKGSVSDQIE